MAGHVLALRRDGQQGTIQAHDLVVEGHALNSTAHGLARERRPLARGRHLVGPIDLHLKGRADLVVQLEDGDRVVMQPGLDVFDCELALRDRSQQEREGVLDTSSSARLLLERVGQLVGKATDGENIDGAQILPQRSLVLDGWQERVAGVVLLGQIERVDRDVAGDLQALFLAQSDELDVLLGGDGGHVDTAVVQTSQEKDRGQVGGPSIGDDGLVRRPGVEVSLDSGDLADVVREVVERDEERSDVAGHLADLVGVGRGSRHREVVVAVSTALSILLGELEAQGVGDGSLGAERHDANHAESGRDGSLGHVLQVIVSARDQAGDERRNVDQTGQLDGTVAGLVVADADVEIEVASDGFDENLGVLHVRDQGNLVVNGHAPSLVTLAHVVGRAPVLVVRWQVDVQVDRVLGKMLGEGVLGRAILGLIEDLEEADADAVLLEEIGGSSGSEQVVSHLLQFLYGRKHLLLVLVRADGQ